MKTNWLVVVVGGVAMASVAGCAGQRTVAGGGAAEIRGSAAIAGGAARPLVTGPIRLLHVNTDAAAAPKLSRVWVRDGKGTGDCRNGTPLDWDWGRPVQIEKDELVCVESAHPARISWHGRAFRQGTGAGVGLGVGKPRTVVAQQAGLR